MLGNWNKCREERVGIMLHYDASTSDPGAIAWLTKDERCKVSYTDLFMDDGRVIQIAPENARAWHAGNCRPSGLIWYKDANSAFYGLSIAAGAKDMATYKQIESLIKRCVELFKKHKWTAADVSKRITDHEAEAWPRGRKCDVYGDKKVRTKPVLDIELVRGGVAKALGG